MGTETTTWQVIVFVAQLGFAFTWGCIAAMGSLTSIALLAYGVWYRLLTKDIPAPKNNGDDGMPKEARSGRTPIGFLNGKSS
jgi:hypothetical protein